uniref:Exonuclease n=1 Tax=uncultured marine virus TaxID=186617 RepID=A0A0F7LB74_9VIRU|nr:exonuclease [uncultured marine virus]
MIALSAFPLLSAEATPILGPSSPGELTSCSGLAVWNSLGSRDRSTISLVTISVTVVSPSLETT